MMVAVSEQCCPIFSSRFETIYPGLSVGTKKHEIPFLPADLSVTANTSAIWACLPVVINCLVPFNTHSSPSRSALHSSALASEPACGSVTQKQPSHSPVASLVKYCCFCASVP